MKTELVNSTPARWWSLLGLVLVPLLVAGGFLMAGLTSDHRFGQVRAAVVNLDEPITLNGKYIPLGRQLTANLVDSQRVQNLGWRLDTEANAKAGLANGSYAAMVVIRRTSLRQPRPTRRTTPPPPSGPPSSCPPLRWPAWLTRLSARWSRWPRPTRSTRP